MGARSPDGLVGQRVHIPPLAFWVRFPSGVKWPFCSPCHKLVSVSVFRCVHLPCGSVGWQCPRPSPTLLPSKVTRTPFPSPVCHHSPLSCLPLPHPFLTRAYFVLFPACGCASERCHRSRCPQLNTPATLFITHFLRSLLPLCLLCFPAALLSFLPQKKENEAVP